MAPRKLDPRGTQAVKRDIKGKKAKDEKSTAKKSLVVTAVKQQLFSTVGDSASSQVLSQELSNSVERIVKEMVEHPHKILMMENVSLMTRCSRAPTRPRTRGSACTQHCSS